MWTDERIQDRQGRRTYRRLMRRGVTSVAKLLITSAGDVLALRQMDDLEAHYERPPRRYALPDYKRGMPYCRTDEPFLRPTPYCDSRAPEVVALANELGAYVLPDREFAEAAYDFAKEKMVLEIAPIDGVAETLRRGTGTCFQLITVFIALCRAAGIPARYKIFSPTMIDAWREATIDADPLVKKWYDSLGYFLLEGEGEAYVDGEWLVAHVGPTAERQAAAGIPISRLGEDAIGSWFTARPGSMMRLESLPRGLVISSRILHALSPGSMERINVSVQQKIAEGRRVIDEAGGMQAYDRRARESSRSAAADETATRSERRTHALTPETA